MSEENCPSCGCHICYNGGDCGEEIERLTDELVNLEEVAKDRYCKMQTEIERLREELSIARLQRDAKLSSQTAVDEAAAREIERLRNELDRRNFRLKRYLELTSLERLEEIIALNCDPCAATDEDAKVITECYLRWDARQEGEVQ